MEAALFKKMLNIKELTKALKQVADEKGLDPDKVLDVIESSIAAAYKKEYGERGEVVRCKLDQKTGELIFSKIKTVVDESTVRFVEESEELQEGEEKKDIAAEDNESDEQKLPRFNPERHITLDEAKKVKKAKKDKKAKKSKAGAKKHKKAKGSKKASKSKTKSKKSKTTASKETKKEEKSKKHFSWSKEKKSK